MLKLTPKLINPSIDHLHKSTKKQYCQFILSLLGTALSPVLAVGLLNYTIDPYGIFKTPTIPKFNLLKPVQDKQVRLFKAVEIIQLQPQRIFLGSSRAILGLNPDHGAFQDNLVTYNLGLTGPSMKEIRKYFDHSLTNQPNIRQVILALDFFMFKNSEGTEESKDNNILGKQQIPVSEPVRLTLSLDTLQSSQKTLEDNLSSNKSKPYYFYGMRRDTYSYQEKDKIESFKYQINNYLNSFYKDYKLSPEALKELKKIVILCQERNIDLKIFISPIHATQMETIERSGLWDEYETWKREVSKIAPFWDFTTYNKITTEPINNSMKGFHDNAHYTEKVGNLVLNRVFAYQVEAVPTDFGILVSSQNIESHLKEILLGKERWQKAAPKEVELVNKIYKKLKK